MVESTLQRYTLNDAKWHYEHGLQVMAIQKVGEATGEERYLKFATDWVDCFVQPDGGIRTYRADEYNVDQINAAVASGDMPDIVGVIDPNRRGLLEQWAADGVIIAEPTAGLMSPAAVEPAGVKLRR